MAAGKQTGAGGRTASKTARSAASTAKPKTPAKTAAAKTAKAPAKSRARAAAKKTPTVRKTAVRRQPRQMSLLERVELGEVLAVERAKMKPKSWPQLSKELGHPETTLRAWHARYERDIDTVIDSTGRTMLTQALAIYQQIVRHMSDLAVNADSDSAKVGAAGRLMEAIRSQVRLMSAMDRMPRSFRAQRELGALVEAVQRIMGIIERRELGDDILREFMDVLEEVQPVIDGTGRMLPSGEPVAA